MLPAVVAIVAIRAPLLDDFVAVTADVPSALFFRGGASMERPFGDAVCADHHAGLKLQVDEVAHLSVTRGVSCGFQGDPMWNMWVM